MATHNVDDGTGGMDGSIVYELGRPEVSLLHISIQGPACQLICFQLRLEFWNGLQ
jgi:hypothetical protein